MAKIKTFYHEEQMKESTRSTSYCFTLPVVNGDIQDDGRLDALYDEIATTNADIRLDTRCRHQRRYRVVIDLKWRGPRHGQRYDSPRQYAHAVDVYARARSEW